MARSVQPITPCRRQSPRRPRRSTLTQLAFPTMPRPARQPRGLPRSRPLLRISSRRSSRGSPRWDSRPHRCAPGSSSCAVGGRSGPDPGAATTGARARPASGASASASRTQGKRPARLPPQQRRQARVSSRATCSPALGRCRERSLPIGAALSGEWRSSSWSSCAPPLALQDHTRGSGTSAGARMLWRRAPRCRGSRAGPQSGS
mmetsp:Transcript_70701/g.218301  ORF Transcript_70701/g.218301 Transcript_70701/m.218301 type:complete len:204 (-) Transcript_70701:252-863(-)